MITIDEAMASFGRLEQRIQSGTLATLELITWGLMSHRLDDLVMLTQGKAAEGMTATAIRHGWDDLDRAIERRIPDLARGRR